jgi:hypothetical protein
MFSLAVLASLPSVAPAQLLATDHSSGAIQVILMAADGGPAPITADPTLPPIFPGDVEINVGFEYLRPDFPGGRVRVPIPAGVNVNVSTIAGSGDLSYNFAFVPKFTAGYQFADLRFGVTASGELATLSGHLNRTIDSAGGSANLTASSTVNFANANVLEGTVPILLGQCPCFEESCFQDTNLLITLGARYSHLSQDYNASVNSGGNGGTVSAHQDWDGYGITTSLSILQPLPCDFYVYGISRGSFLLGNDNRVSSTTVVTGTTAAASTTTKLTENKTDFIPIGEFEIGVAWGKPLAPHPAAAAGTVPPKGALLWVKVGLVASVWGNLSVLSAQDSVQGFTDSRFFLWGFSVLAGVQF